jgi:hypothetical protein
MASLAKKIKKSVVKSGNAICIEASDATVSDIADYFPNVFVFSNEDSVVKKKNIIYRESIEDLNKLPEVRFIYIGGESVHSITKLKTFIEQYQAVLVIGTGEWLNKKHARSLAEIRYKIIDKSKHWQLWTLPK